MSAATLTLLKVGFLILLYLFLFRAIRAVYLEVSPRRAASMAPPPAPVPGQPVPAAPAPAPPSTKQAKRSRRQPHLRFVAPEGAAGRTLVLEGEVVMGRGAGCTVQLDDTFTSQSHARFLALDGGWAVEDLGSTNGTFVNGERISRPTRLRKGDRVTVGQTVMEMR